MSFFSWLPNQSSTRNRQGPGQHRPLAPRFRPRLEALEGRWLPSTLTVTNNADSGAGSLRADIAAANSGDTIVFASSLNGQTITLTSGELSITKGLAIQGPGAGKLTVSGNNKFRVFEVNASQPVILTGLTMTGGSGSPSGGAIFNHSVLTVGACNITGHAQYGGGIYNTGTLGVRGCTLNGDSAGTFGGGIYNSPSGKLTVGQSTLHGDTAISLGGGVYNLGTMTASSSTLSDNLAGSGGGIYASGIAGRLSHCPVARPRRGNRLLGAFSEFGERSADFTCLAD